MDSYPGDFPFGIMDVVELLHLRIRRRQANSVYVDCPFCGDRRGKMNVNFVKNVWRCNYCDEHGGMLALYARLNNTTTSDAYWEIGEALCNDFHRERPNSGYEMAGNQQAGTGSPVSGTQTDLAGYERRGELKTVQQAERASGQEIHQTLSLLLAMLPLQPAHRNHLHSPKRGLSDEQIDRIGFKSTPPPFLCRSITERLMKQGCKVEGVPGFYLDDSGRWTMNFYRKNAGILIPAVGYDGMIHGLQILLDSPLKQKDDPPDKSGAKYIWFSSSSKNMGVTSGSPVHFIGNPSARVVYVIEGLLKADISHCLTNRTFAAIAGANNTSQLDKAQAIEDSPGDTDSFEPGAAFIHRPSGTGEVHEQQGYRSSDDGGDSGDGKDLGVYILHDLFGLGPYICCRISRLAEYHGHHHTQEGAVSHFGQRKPALGLGIRLLKLRSLRGFRFLQFAILQF